MSDKRDSLLVTAGLAFLFGLTSGVALSAATGVLVKILKPIAPPPATGRKDLGSPKDYQFPLLSASQPAKDSALQRLEKMFNLSTTKLHEIVKYFVREMQRGLAAEGQTLKMIPSYVSRRATGSETGIYLALDLGGSNFRVCEVFLEGKGQVRMKQKKYVVSEALKTGDGPELFDFFASSIREFYEENDIQRESFRRLGFTFSFPCNQVSIDKGNMYLSRAR